jgi:hypothetical protein
MKIKQITENTTSGSIATVDTALGGTQSRGNPSIYGGKKVGSLFKGKKTKAPYANSINESAELSEAQLEEDDVIVVPGQGRSRKNGFVPHGQSRVDHEVEMARSDLFSAAKNAQQVYSMIKDVSEDEGLDGWVQEKIIKANDYLNTIREYLEGKQVQGVAEGLEQPNEAGQAVQKLKQIAGMRSQFTYNGLQEAGHADIVLNAIKACSTLINHFKNNKQLSDAQITSNLQKEIIAFKNGDAFTTLGQLLQGTLSKINFQQGVAEGKRNLKCVCKTHGTMQCPVHTPKDIEVIENNKNKKA